MKQRDQEPLLPVAGVGSCHLRHLFRSSFCHDLSACGSTFQSQVDNPISRLVEGFRSIRKAGKGKVVSELDCQSVCGEVSNCSAITWSGSAAGSASFDSQAAAVGIDGSGLSRLFGLFSLSRSLGCLIGIPNEPNKPKKLMNQTDQRGSHSACRDSSPAGRRVEAHW